MLSVWLVRHSMTEGNLKKRYIGRTDEPLCQEGRELLEHLSYPQPERLWGSPLKRCRETAEYLYPGLEYYVIPELSECDFGEFENHNYLELADNPQYQQWVDSGGRMPFPGGESREEFHSRTLRGFEKAITESMEKGCSSIALVVHGGTVMNVMEACTGRPGSFYEWHVENGKGYMLYIQEESWKQGERKIQSWEKL